MVEEIVRLARIAYQGEQGVPKVQPAFRDYIKADDEVPVCLCLTAAAAYAATWLAKGRAAALAFLRDLDAATVEGDDSGPSQAGVVLAAADAVELGSESVAEFADEDMRSLVLDDLADIWDYGDASYPFYVEQGRDAVLAFRDEMQRKRS